MKSRGEMADDLPILEKPTRERRMFAAALAAPVAMWALGILLIVYGWPI